MVQVQHSAIADSERHPPKGASLASSGQVMKADGGDSVTWVNPSTLNNIIISTALESFNTSTQTPSALDTALQVVFGGAVAGTDVSISSGGLVTFNTAGVYAVNINLVVSRTSAAGNANLVTRVKLNGTAIDPVYFTSLAEDDNAVVLTIHLLRSFAATNTLTVEFMRDSGGSGLDNGILQGFNPTTSGWANTPSAYVKIQKLTGAA